MSKIGVNSIITEKLYSNGELNSPEFIDHITNFSEFTFKVSQNSPMLDNILFKLSDLKDYFLNKKTNIFIEIEIECENGHQFTNSQKEKIDKVSFNLMTSIISNYYFNEFINLKEISIPSSVSLSIGYNSFENCKSLKEIKIPPFAMSIGNYAFKGCSSLTIISIPFSVITVGTKMFEGCSSLTQVTIPDTISLDLDPKVRKNIYEVNSNDLFEIGQKHYNGDGFSVSYEIALKYIKMSIGKWNSNAMNLYTFMCFNGEGIPFNENEAIGFNKTANEIQQKEGYQIFFDEVNKYLKIAINKSNVKLIRYYCQLLQDDEDNKQLSKEACEYYKTSICKGNSTAMFNYGYMLQYGDGLPINKDEAAKYYKMAIGKGDSDAMYQYAYMLHKKIGIEENKDEVIKYYKMAIDKGNSNAVNNYAYMLSIDDKTHVSINESIKYYKMAIEKGNTTAMGNYAIMLQKGKGIPINIEEAIKYFKMAIELGDIAVMTSYAGMLKASNKSMNPLNIIKWLLKKVILV